MKQSTSSTFRRTILALVAATASFVMVLDAAHASEVSNPMKEMKNSYAGAMKSNSIEEFSTFEKQLESAMAKAGKAQYKKNPKTYQEGMNKLQQQLNQVSAAVQAKDLKAAKGALLQLNATRKYYHDKLR